MNRTAPLRLLTLFSLGLAALLFSASTLAQSKSAGEHVDDSWIHTKVKSTLSTKGGAGINVEVHKGEVQLAGFVRDEDLTKSLPDEASRIAGVTKVYNQIIFVEPGRSAGRRLDDSVLAGKVEAAMAGEDFGQSLSVNTEVDRGVVLLSGFLDSEEERDAVVETVRRVEGVERVINGINIKIDA
ncbi:MAG: BON domain-containing protein [Pseudomonadota bacterium]